MAVIAAGVIAAGASIAGGVMQSNAAKKASGAQMAAGKKAAADMGKYVKDIKWKDVAPPDQVDPWAVAEKAYDTNMSRSIEILKKSQEYGALRTAEFGSRLEELVPGAKDLIASSVKNIGEQMRGELPSDVKKQLALAAVGQGGRGGRGTAARNLSMASLGLTSLEATRYGNDASLKLMQPFQNAAMDMSVMSPAMMQYTLMTPGQFYEASNQQAMNQYNARLQNAQGQMNAALNRFNAAQGVAQTSLGNTVGALATQMGGSALMAQGISNAGSQIAQGAGMYYANRQGGNIAGGSGGSAGGSPVSGGGQYMGNYNPTYTTK